MLRLCVVGVEGEGKKPFKNLGQGFYLYVYGDLCMCLFGRNKVKTKFMIIKQVIDSWNPYELLPYAPNDEFDSEIRMITDGIRDTDNVMDIAKIVSDVFTSQFGEECFCVVNCFDVAKTIHKKLSEQFILGVTQRG